MDISVYLCQIRNDFNTKCANVLYLFCRGHAGTHWSCGSLRELHVQVQPKHDAHTDIQTLFLDYQHNVFAHIILNNTV